MDELLHEPRRLGEAGADLPLGKKLRGFAEALQEKTALAWEEAQPKLRVARKWLSEHPISPLVYLAVATAVGVGAVVSAVYSPSYVVNVDGVDIGVVSDPAVYEQAVSHVETRAAHILGYDYVLENEVTFTRALTEKDGFSTMGQLETYLFNQIGEVMKSYVLTVDGVTIGASDDQERAG